MSDFEGTWDLTMKTPVGEMQSELVLQDDVEGFRGTNVGDMGSSDFGGTVENGVLRWRMDVSVPMRMTLDCTATVAGDALDGSVVAGAMGRFPSMTGRRAR